MAYELMVPFAQRLKVTLPDIQLHVLSGEEYIDLSRGQAELALRARAPSQPDLEVVAELRLKMGVFASQAYADRLQARPRPLRALELDWVAWAFPLEHLEPTPTLKKLIPEFRPAFAANDHNVQCRAVAEGLGVMVLPCARSEHHPYPPFVELDVDLSLPPVESHLVCAKAMRWVPRVRAVISELVLLLRSVEGVRVVC
jgi:DNA-binding transcriptional LysR family regulator